MDMLSREQRHYPRFRRKVPTSMQFRKDGAILQTTTRDVSVEGAEFEWGRSVQPGERILFHIKLTNSVFRCEGMVQWVRSLTTGQYFFGVRFLNLREDQYQQMEEFLGKVPTM